MKTLLYLTSAVILILTASCRSVEKLVDEGRYDEAIVLATKKLAGKKKKKTKHIVALEEAFTKVNKRDLEFISFHREQNNDSSWEDIYNFAMQIQSRQNRITPFLPLISKEGYVGTFHLLETKSILTEARNKAAAHLYERGKYHLQFAKETGDKFAGQEAYYHFRKIERYFDTYKDVDRLLIESRSLGTFHVLLKWEDLNSGNFTRMLSEHQLSQLGGQWTIYHADHEDGLAFDAISTFRLDNIDISPEGEIVNNFTESKQLERWVDDLDENGNVKRDSTGQIIRYKEVEKVRADIIEVFRTKDAIITGSTEIRDYKSGALINHDQFEHIINFASNACSMTGDRRAISDDVSKRIDLRLLGFPPDHVMIEEGIKNIQNDFFDHLQRLDIEEYFRSGLALRYNQ